MLENIERLSLLIDKLIAKSIDLSSDNMTLQSAKDYSENEIDYLKKTLVEQESEIVSLKTKSKNFESLVAVLQIDIKKIDQELREQLRSKEIIWSEKEKDMLSRESQLQERIISLETKNNCLKQNIVDGLDRLKQLKSLFPVYHLDEDGDVKNGAA